ncbi:MAG: glycosyltransferase family 4 protein [Candidatus Paceibacterota bacterium]|jgi:glycosyltransferase involved in cell wall biosynthesis
MISPKLKNIYFLLPRSLRVLVLRTYENYFAFKTAQKTKAQLALKSNRQTNKRPKVLFFDLCGGGHGGTSKEMQILAKYLDKSKYDVYFMYSSKQAVNRINVEGTLPTNGSTQRAKKLEEYGVKLIDFQYESVNPEFPYIISGMNPNFFDVLKNKNIDILIVTTDGKSYFPFNLVRDIPIILLNVFGSYSVQKNISYNVGYTQELTDRINRVVDKKIIRQMYIPCEYPTPNSIEDGKALRNNLGIKDTDVVFGRIGRNVDAIFDTIGINAFKKIVAKYPEAHFLIVSPPPALEKIVEEEKIPNVHLLPPTASEEEIWAFHQANDVYAHFRKDGETFGLNIAEAMMCGKPIITHRSFMWNGHLEYLEPAFSRVADIDDVEGYAKFMEEYIEINKNGALKEVGLFAKTKAEKIFSPTNIINEFELLIDSSIK